MMIFILLDYFPKLTNGLSESSSLSENDADEVQG